MVYCLLHNNTVAHILSSTSPSRPSRHGSRIGTGTVLMLLWLGLAPDVFTADAQSNKPVIITQDIPRLVREGFIRLEPDLSIAPSIVERGEPATLRCTVITPISVAVEVRVAPGDSAGTRLGQTEGGEPFNVRETVRPSQTTTYLIYVIGFGHTVLVPTVTR